MVTAIEIVRPIAGSAAYAAALGEIARSVSAGEPLGILPVKDTSERQELYFEWRRNGEPVDPMEQKFRSPSAKTLK